MVVLDQEVHELLNKNVIEICSNLDCILSPVFVVPKKEGTNHQSESPKLLPQHSALQDGKYLYRQRYFERGRLYGQDRSQRHLFQCEDPSSPQEVLKFQWRGITYQYKALPFGLATAPRVFSKIMQGAISHVREKGVRLVQYLDDILVIASSPNQLKEHMKLVAQHLQT